MWSVDAARAVYGQGLQGDRYATAVFAASRAQGIGPRRRPERASTRPGSRAGAAEERRASDSMMNGLKQSDSAIVPMSAANKGTSVPAESTEGRAGTKGNPRSQSTHRTESRVRVSPAAERIRQTATRKPKEKLTALLHHITTEALGAASLSLKTKAAAGMDGGTWEEYGHGLAERLHDLPDRIHSGAYRTRPSRRVHIPKPDGGTRPRMSPGGGMPARALPGGTRPDI